MSLPLVPHYFCFEHTHTTGWPRKGGSRAAAGTQAAQRALRHCADDTLQAMAAAGDELQATLRAGLNLMRRLPPRDVKQNLFGLTSVQPDLLEEFLQRVDQPLETRICAATKRRFLLCDYNRDGDSYRSPWSNAYNPPLEEGFAPSPALRELEVAANEVFDMYREVCATLPRPRACVHEESMAAAPSRLSSLAATTLEDHRRDSSQRVDAAFFLSAALE